MPSLDLVCNKVNDEGRKPALVSGQRQGSLGCKKPFIFPTKEFTIIGLKIDLQYFAGN